METPTRHPLLEYLKGDLMLFNLLFDPAFLKVQGTPLQLGKVEGTTRDEKTPPSVNLGVGGGRWRRGASTKDSCKGRFGVALNSIFQWLLTVCVLPQATKKKHLHLHNLSTAPSRVPVTANSVGPAAHRACVVRHGAEFERKRAPPVPPMLGDGITHHPATPLAMTTTQVVTEGSASLARAPNDGDGDDTGHDRGSAPALAPAPVLSPTTCTLYDDDQG
ncbi:hypothetical protein EDB83DRAFT_2315087 [Lactarius deliciosus]|nr:hypothetical protein EDB83DRAFT_2315087 [Lactarius deliciosus]